MAKSYQVKLEPPEVLASYYDSMGPRIPDAGAIAVLVCLGMGQQVPFETLDSVAKAIYDGHQKPAAKLR